MRGPRTRLPPETSGSASGSPRKVPEGSGTRGIGRPATRDRVTVRSVTSAVRSTILLGPSSLRSSRKGGSALYGSIVTWQFKPGTYDQVSSEIRERFVPALTQQPGFRSLSIIRTGEDAVTTIIVYDSQEHAESSFPLMATMVRERIGSQIADMQRSAGEVVSEERVS